MVDLDREARRLDGDLRDVEELQPLALLLRRLALLRGRTHVTAADIHDLAKDVLRHRLILSYDALADGVKPEELLDRVLDVVAARSPPAKQGHRLKLLYMAQIGTKPPRFSIQVNSRQRVTRDYAYYVENRLRERYGLDGIPLVIDFAERKRRSRAGQAA